MIGFVEVSPEQDLGVDIVFSMSSVLSCVDYGNEFWPLCSGLEGVIAVLGASWLLGGMLNIYEIVFVGTLLHPLPHADGKVFFENAAEICLEILKDLGLRQEETGGV